MRKKSLIGEEGEMNLCRELGEGIAVTEMVC